MARSSESTKHVLQKIFAVLEDVEYMKKEGRNDFQRYNFLAEAQVTIQIRDLLIKHGLVVTTEKVTPVGEGVIIEKKEGKSDAYLSTFVYTFRFSDPETGEWLLSDAPGQGADSSDKGVNKSYTAAAKYNAMKTFWIPTGDDPELPNYKEQAAQSTPKPAYKAPASTPAKAPVKAAPKPAATPVAQDDKPIEEIFTDFAPEGVNTNPITKVGSTTYQDLNEQCDVCNSSPLVMQSGISKAGKAYKMKKCGNRDCTRPAEWL